MILIIFYSLQQEGQLCAQHALNNLVQMKIYDAVMLAEIANALDLQEREKMAEGGIDSPEYQEWSKMGSRNMDETGYFSIQVIQMALERLEIQIVNYFSDNEIAIKTRANANEAQAFIIHFNKHWFTIRKLGYQWFNLNSLLSRPELLSELHLSILLSQLVKEEESHIFIVTGQIPISDTDKYLMENPIDPKSVMVKSSPRVRHDDEQNDPDLMETIEASKASTAEMEEKFLQNILQQSLRESQTQVTSQPTDLNTPMPSSLSSSLNIAPESSPSTNLNSLSEDEMLALAIHMSQDQ